MPRDSWRQRYNSVAEVKSLTRARVAQYDSRHIPGKSQRLLRADLTGNHDDSTVHRGKVHSFLFDFFRARSTAIKQKRKKNEGRGGGTRRFKEESPTGLEFSESRLLSTSSFFSALRMEGNDFSQAHAVSLRSHEFFWAASRLLSTLFLNTKRINIFRSKGFIIRFYYENCQS